MPLEQHLQESRAVSTPLEVPKCSHCNAQGLSHGVQDSGSPVLASGGAGLWLWAGCLYSHHFNKEMIKRRWGGGKENPKTSVLLQIREDSFACKECVNHGGLGDVRNPA